VRPPRLPGHPLPRRLPMRYLPAFGPGGPRRLPRLRHHPGITRPPPRRLRRYLPGLRRDHPPLHLPALRVRRQPRRRAALLPLRPHSGHHRNLRPLPPTSPRPYARSPRPLPPPPTPRRPSAGWPPAASAACSMTSRPAACLSPTRPSLPTLGGQRPTCATCSPVAAPCHPPTGSSPITKPGRAAASPAWPATRTNGCCGSSPSGTSFPACAPEPPGVPGHSR